MLAYGDVGTTFEGNARPGGNNMTPANEVIDDIGSGHVGMTSSGTWTELRGRKAERRDVSVTPNPRRWVPRA